MEVGLLLLRLVTLAGHGAQKLFGWFGGQVPPESGEGARLRADPPPPWQ
jgi:hypothetical protein